MVSPISRSRIETLFDSPTRELHLYLSTPVDNQVLTVTGATKTFGDVAALAGADLSLARGMALGRSLIERTSSFKRISKPSPLVF